MLDKSVRILKILKEGIPIKYNDEIYYLSEDNYLCVERYSYIEGEYIGKRYLPIDVSFNWFLNVFCENKKEDEITVGIANLALNKYKEN